MRRGTELSSKPTHLDLQAIHQQSSAGSLATATLHARYHDPTFFAPLCHQPPAPTPPRLHTRWSHLLWTLHSTPILPESMRLLLWNCLVLLAYTLNFY